MIDETFTPNTACTRAQAVTFMWVASGKPEAAASSFTDVAEGADYAAAVNWAVAQGVTKGTGDGTTFSPENVCSRGQIATFLYRAANTPLVRRRLFPLRRPPEETFQGGPHMTRGRCVRSAPFFQRKPGALSRTEIAGSAVRPLEGRPGGPAAGGAGRPGIAD